MIDIFLYDDIIVHAGKSEGNVNENINVKAT